MARIYGMHLAMRIADVGEDGEMAKPTTVGNFLTTLVNRIGMRILAGPLVQIEETTEPAKFGCSGVVILYESHAAIHTYPHLAEAFIDIFSCRKFNAAEVDEVVRAFFGRFRTVEKLVLKRGRHWGSDINREIATWKSSRESTVTNRPTSGAAF